MLERTIVITQATNQLVKLLGHDIFRSCEPESRLHKEEKHWYVITKRFIPYDLNARINNVKAQ